MSLQRQFFQPEGGQPVVWFVVFCADVGPLDLKLSASRHRTRGLPEGLQVARARRGDDAFPDFLLNPQFLGLLAERAPLVVDDVSGCEVAITVQGAVDDASSLQYLRDIVGVIQALVEAQQGVAVVAPFALKWWSASQWTTEIFVPEALPARDFVSLFGASYPDGFPGVRMYTRGLGLFGRPDLSAHRIIEPEQEAFVEVFERLIHLHIHGAVVPDGEVIDAPGLSERLSLHHAGDFEDPEFNNRHLDIRRTA